MKYKYLPHTAEMEFAAYGSSFSEMVENAAEALLNIMLDIKKIAKSEGKERSLVIKERVRTHDDAVWYSLQDILSKVDEKALSAYRFEVDGVGKPDAKGYFRISGRLLYKELGKDLSLLEVKAVTPHDLKVVHEKGRWSVRIVVDV